MRLSTNNKLPKKKKEQSSIKILSMRRKAKVIIPSKNPKIKKIS